MKSPFALSAAAMVLLVSCSETPPPQAAAPRVVKAITVGATGGGHARSFGGDVRARHEAAVGFRVAGKVVERLVEVGSPVRTGQALLRLDPGDLALQASQAEAQRALAEAEAKRYHDLREQRFVSQAALDARETAYKAAAASAALARNQSAYATLVADRAGVVAEVLAQPGQVVAAGQSVLRMTWDGEREIALSIPEDALADIRVGAPADITLWSMPRKRLQGHVREVAPSADPVTRTYAVRVAVAGDDLPLGMSAAVSFPLQRAATITVPMSSIFQQGEQPAVWVIGADDKLVLRRIRVSAYGDDGVRLAEGLVAGERIVSAGANRLQAGETVQVAKGSP